MMETSFELQRMTITLRRPTTHMLRYGAKRPVRTSMKMECGIDIPKKENKNEEENHIVCNYSYADFWAYRLQSTTD